MEGSSEVEAKVSKPRAECQHHVVVLRTLQEVCEEGNNDRLANTRQSS
jgi:hypothetical protein